MRVSIVTCTWNSEPFLADSIASVLAQDYPDIEYIFVDGGSTDGTLERIESIARPVIILRHVTGGISRAMNAGLARARGDIIAHLHSDDWYLHGQVISRVVEVFRQTGAQWLFGRNLRWIRGEVAPEPWQAPPYHYARLLRRNFIAHEATFVRRSLFERAGGFSERWRYAMDYDLWLRLGRLAEPVQLDEALAVFREHSGSLSSSHPAAGLTEDFRVRLSHLGPRPLAWMHHGARYLVRRARLELDQLRAAKLTAPRP